MSHLKLYMLLLGCKPQGRHTEQHDIFFGIGESLKSLVPSILDFWKEANSKIHIDGWREVTCQDGYHIEVVPKEELHNASPAEKLFFINLGGYKPNEFEEFHYKILLVNANKANAIQQAKQNVFFKHTISPHIDDKYGVDVDDIYEIEEILPAEIKERYTIRISSAENTVNDELHLGYFKLDSL